MLSKRDNEKGKLLSPFLRTYSFLLPLALPNVFLVLFTHMVNPVVGLGETLFTEIAGKRTLSFAKNRTRVRDLDAVVIQYDTREETQLTVYRCAISDSR